MAAPALPELVIHPGPEPGARDEAGLVVLAMNGDQRAFTEIVQRRQSGLRNLLRRLCRDRALADDLAQQAFLQAWRSLPSLRSPAAFGAWLRRLAVNAFLAHLRSSAAQPHLDLDEQALGETPATGVQVDLDRALAQLTPAQRLCVVLAYNEGMSHREISVAAGMPIGTVKSHVARGAERLRAALKAYAGNEEFANAG